MTAEQPNVVGLLACPRALHSGSAVRRFGVRMSSDGSRAFQRFQCVPVRPVGAAEDDTRWNPHTFQLPLSAAAVEATPYVPPEPCPRHPGSKVVRYGVATPPKAANPPVTGSRRRKHPTVAKQRYRCTPANGKPHTFTPRLPRQVVSAGDSCPACGQGRCVHRGETVVARGHRYPTWVVAEALRELGAGQSYGAVSVRAFERLGGGQSDLLARMTGVTATPGPGQGSRKNAWRLAADWTELFAPVLWDPWASDRIAEVRRVLELPARQRPASLVVIDDIPVFRTQKVRGRAEQKFAVLAAFEVFIPREQRPAEHRLRLLRAFPRRDADAYRLLLNELGYTPDFVLADGATGIFEAVRGLLRAGGHNFQPMLSAYHVRRHLRRLFATLHKRGGFHPGDLDVELENWTFCASAAAWQAWWAKFEARARAQGLPPSAWNTQWVQRYKPVFDAQMPVLDELGTAPRTSGALEAVLHTTIRPSVISRARGFGNLVRTNRVLDLMVLAANNQLDNTPAVTATLRADAEAHSGFAAPTRTIVDSGTYRSLTDPAVLDELTANAGLS